jgi:hypothetical protein
VTKSPKRLRQRAAWRSGDQAGRNASERRAGLETIDVGADPALPRGSVPLVEADKRVLAAVSFLSAKGGIANKINDQTVG